MSADYRTRDTESESGEKAKDMPTGSRLTQVGLDAIQGNLTDKSESPAQDQPRDSEHDLAVGANDTHVIGDPGADADYWHFQGDDRSCAVVAQEGIIRKYTGENVTQQSLIEQAEQHGWLDKDGTRPNNVGKLLQMHGFDVRQLPNSSISALRDAVAAKQAVIAAVDAGRLWEDRDIGEGHAVWATGVDVDQQGGVSGVFVNDSGMSDDGGSRIPVEQFLKAWKELGNYMVVAQPHVTETGASREVRNGIQH